MGLDTFPLLKNNIYLITYNNIVFKLKLEYQEISQQQREAFSQVVSEQTAHCQIEDVCRAVLYNIERREELSPIQTDNFIIFPEVCNWPLGKKMQFFVNGKKLSCHPDLILFKLTCKHVAVSGPDKFLADVASSNRSCMLSADTLETRAICNNQAKQTAESIQCTSNNRTVDTPGFEINQIRGQNKKNDKRKEEFNIVLPVGSCNEMSDIDSELGQSGGSDQVSDRDTPVLVNSISQINNDEELCNSNQAVDEKYNNKELLLPVRITRSQLQKRQYLRNTFQKKEIFENEIQQLPSQSKRRHANNKRNWSTVLKYKGSVMPAIKRYQSNKSSKVHYLKKSAKPEKEDLLKKSGNNQSCFDIIKQHNLSLEMSDRDVVEISDDGSIIYELERMNDLEGVASVIPIAEIESYNRKKKNHVSAEYIDQLQKSRSTCQSPLSHHVKKRKQMSSIARITDENNSSNCGTPAGKQKRPKKSHVAQSLGENDNSNTTFSSSKGRTHASQSKMVSDVNTVDPQTNIAQNTRSKLSSTIPDSSRRATRSFSVNLSWQETGWSSKTLNSRRPNLSQSPILRKKTSHALNTLERKRELFEAEHHLLKSKDGVWFFWK